MKISGYHKDCGDCVQLKTDYDNLNEFDKVYISKVFTDTPINENILKLPNVEYGGTGFYFDQAPDLPYEIEHYMPDYHLYDDWIEEQLSNGIPKNQFKEYRDYSIGFLTRGCFRKLNNPVPVVLPQLSVIIVISHVPQLCFKQLPATSSIHCTFYHF